MGIGGHQPWTACWSKKLPDHDGNQCEPGVHQQCQAASGRHEGGRVGFQGALDVPFAVEYRRVER